MGACPLFERVKTEDSIQNKKATKVSGADSNSRLKGLFRLGRRRGIMSDEFKYELAKDLGFYDTVKNGGWGEIRARDAGNMVKRAIELAQQHMAQDENQR